MLAAGSSKSAAEVLCPDSRCAWQLSAPLHGSTKKARQDCVPVGRSSWQRHASPYKVQHVQQGWCMSMEMAWHFDGEKAKLQVLIPNLNSLPCMRTGARAGEQQVGSGLRHGAETWVTPQWLIWCY